MRFSAHLFCLAASLAAAPAFAQPAKQTGPTTSSPQSLSSQSKPALEPAEQSPSFNLGLGFSKGGTERSLLPLAPIQKDQVELTWKPASNLGFTLDMTSRSQNDLFPREEMTAGVTYQVTPRFRLGGGVTVKGDGLADSIAKQGGANFGKEVSEAQVRIESAFSF